MISIYWVNKALSGAAKLDINNASNILYKGLRLFNDACSFAFRV